MEHLGDRLNRPRHRAGARGHYEGWYLTLHDPASGWAFWLRYTLTAYAQGSGVAALWALTFPPAGEGPALELLDHRPLEALQLGDPASLDLRIGPGELTARAARGEVGEGPRRLAWELSFRPSAGGFRHVAPLLFHTRVAGSLVATPHLALAVRGEIQVGERRFLLEDAVGEQGHVFGRRHADRWAWAHAHGFPEAPGALFEGVSAQVEKLGRLLPPATPVLFRDEGGRVHTTRGPLKMWGGRSEFELGRWRFELECGERLLHGTVSAPIDSFVNVEYADPDGGHVYCSHSERADLNVSVFRRRGSGWVFERRYAAPHTTAFEVGERYRDPRPPRRLSLAQARAPG